MTASAFRLADQRTSLSGSASAGADLPLPIQDLPIVGCPKEPGAVDSAVLQ